MKKTIFLGIAVLLTLAVFSCGDPTVPGASVGSTDGITLSGPELARGRALVGATSEAGTNYYEATFQRMEADAGTPTVFDKPTTKIARSKWGYARKGRIQLEPGYYKVILMAGRISDATLLGVGRASFTVETNALTGVAATPVATPAGLVVQILPTTSDIYFNVYALVNDIKDVTGSTFQTTSPTQDFPTPFTKDELGNKIPVFMITKAATPAASTATWKFGLGALPGVTGDQILLFGPEIWVKGAASLYETGFSYTDTYDVPQKLVGKTITAGDLDTGVIDITVTAPDDDGMVQLALEVPVNAIAASDEPMTWFIRGGLNNGGLDAGIAPTYAYPGHIGGAVVLGFGNLSNFPVINLIPHNP